MRLTSYIIEWKQNSRVVDLTKENDEEITIEQKVEELTKNVEKIEKNMNDFRKKLKFLEETNVRIVQQMLTSKDERDMLQNFLH